MQLALFSESTGGLIPKKNSTANKLNEHDRQFHDWYRFVLSFPPHLAVSYTHLDVYKRQLRWRIIAFDMAAHVGRLRQHEHQGQAEHSEQLEICLLYTSRCV